MSRNGIGQIFFYDGTTVRHLPGSKYGNHHPEISGSSVAWVGTAKKVENEFGGVMLYDGTRTVRMSDYGAPGGVGLVAISGLNVAWDAMVGGRAQVFVATYVPEPGALALLAVGAAALARRQRT